LKCLKLTPLKFCGASEGKRWSPRKRWYPGPAGLTGKDGKQGKEGQIGSLNGETSYTRWGSRTCPEDTDLVYTGVTGTSIGSH